MRFCPFLGQYKRQSQPTPRKMNCLSVSLIYIYFFFFLCRPIVGYENQNDLDNPFTGGGKKREKDSHNEIQRHRNNEIMAEKVPFFPFFILCKNELSFEKLCVIRTMTHTHRERGIPISLTNRDEFING